MKTDLFVWGVRMRVSWSTDCPGSWPGRERCWGAGRGGGMSDRSIFVDEKEGHAQRK